MKRQNFFMIAVLAALFISCNVKDGYNEYTPSISIEKEYATLNTKGQVQFKITSEALTFGFDSLHVGDTVGFNLIFNAYGNRLKEFDIVPSDSTAVKLIQPDSIDNYLLSTSDVKKGIYYPKEGIFGLYFPMKFVALKSKESLTYSFKVLSDATVVSNTSSMYIKFPIKQKLPH